MNTLTWRCGSPPNTGQRQRYPGRFMYYLKKNYPQIFKKDTLQMFSGSSDFGITTDIRKETGADYICPFNKIPLPDQSCSNVLADPPYANYFQDEWGGDLPKPKHILKEAARLVKPDGFILILHIIIIPAYKEFSIYRTAMHPVLCGPNNVIRVSNVFRKEVQ